MRIYGISLNGKHEKTVSDLTLEEEEIHLSGSLLCSILQWSKFIPQGVNFSLTFVLHDVATWRPHQISRSLTFQCGASSWPSHEELDILDVVLGGLAVEESFTGRPSSPTSPGVTGVIVVPEVGRTVGRKEVVRTVRDKSGNLNHKEFVGSFWKRYKTDFSST